MRRHVQIILLFGLIISSCTQQSIHFSTSDMEESENERENPENERIVNVNLMEFQLTGAEEISNSLTVACIGDDELSHMPSSWNEMILSYGAKNSQVDFSVNNPSAEFYKYSSFVSEKGKHVVALIDSLGFKDDGYPNLIYAGIKEGARIFANKTLFGNNAGTSLNEYFLVKPYLAYSVTFPDYYVKESHFSEGKDYRCGFSEFHAKGNALTFCNFLTLKECPSETYSEITFTIEIPIECEYMQQVIYGEDYPESYYEQGFVERNENRVLRGSVKVKFNK